MREPCRELGTMSVGTDGEGHELRFDECGDTIFRVRYDSGALGLNVVPYSLVHEFELDYEKEPVMIKLADGTQTTALGKVQLTFHCGGKTSRAEFVVLGSDGKEVFLGLHTMQEVWPERWSWWADEVSARPNTFWSPKGIRAPQEAAYAVLLRPAEEVDEMRARSQERGDFTHPSWEKSLEKFRAALGRLPKFQGVAPIRIKLRPDVSLPPFHNRRFTPTEQAEIEEWVEAALKSGLVTEARVDKYAAQLVGVRVPGKKTRWCVDLRGLNALVETFSLPMMVTDEALSKAGRGKFFTSLDLAEAYHHIEVHPEDRHLLIFVANKRYYHFNRMPFGYRNASHHFNAAMDNIMAPAHKFAIWYLDDILIFSETQEEHIQHVRTVLELLSAAGASIRAEKCFFMVSTVKFLGYRLGGGVVDLTQDRVATLSEYEKPTTIRQLRSFLGALNYVARWLPKAVAELAPLNDLFVGKSPRASSRIIWTEKLEQHFENAKRLVRNSQALALPQDNEPYTIATDASDYGMGAVLLQEHKEQSDTSGCTLLKPVAYWSRKFSPAERNYSTYEKEFLALVSALRQWRHKVENGQTLTVLTDHQPLLRWAVQQELKQRVQRWSWELATFQKLQIVHQPGVLNVVADGLSRLREAPSANVKHSAIPPHLFHHPYLRWTAKEGIRAEFGSMTRLDSPTWRSRLIAEQKAYIADNPDHRLEDRNGICHLRDRIFLPETMVLEVLEHFHDSPLYNHPGREATIKLVCDRFVSKSLRLHVSAYVRSCLYCQTLKARNHKPLANPREPDVIAGRPLEVVSLDVLSALPEDLKCEALLVVVDQFSRYAWVSFCSLSWTAADFYRQLCVLFAAWGQFPKVVKTDGAPTFRSKEWSRLLACKGSIPRVSIPNHPMSNGAAERAIGILLQHIRMARVTIWSKRRYAQEAIVLAAAAMNRIPVSFLGYSPEFILTGFNSDLSELGVVSTTQKTYGEILEEVRERNEVQHQRVVATLKSRTKPHRFKDLDWVLVDVASIWGDHKKAVKYSRPVQVRKASGNTLELFEKPAGGKSTTISSHYAKPYYDREKSIIAKLPGFKPKKANEDREGAGAHSR